MNTKPAVTELIIILSIGVFLWLIAFFSMSALPLDVNMHDTYIVVDSPKLTAAALFILIARWMPFILTLTYLIKEAFWGYKRTLQNGILVISNLILSFQLLRVINYIAQISNDHKGWTIYPPLSAKRSTGDPYLAILSALSPVFYAAAIFFTFTLVIKAVLLGKSLSNKNDQ